MPYTFNMNPEVATLEAQAVTRPTPEPGRPSEKQRYERNRTIAHLGRVFVRRYDIQVLPSRQKGLWATALDPKITQELQKYVMGQKDSLDDLPDESFEPKRILYDEQSAQEMSMEDITAILRHEAGHVKYTAFKLMFEGQRMAKDQGSLPTSFWLMFEGLEDPRVNNLEGEESPAIDKQIRSSNSKMLQEKLTEGPLSQKPLMLQFAYNAYHVWLNGEPAPQFDGKDVGRLTEAARPLIEQYFQNTDVEQRRLLQKQIWEIAKELEKKEIEQEEQRQMAKQKQQGQQGQEGEGQPGGEGQPQAGAGGGGQSSGQSSGGAGEEEPQAGIPSSKGASGGQEQSGQEQSQQGSSEENRQDSTRGSRRFLDRVKEFFSGKKDSQESSQGEQQGQDDSQGGESQGHQIQKPTRKPKPERLDLSTLSDEELQQIKDAIDQLSPEERAELNKKAKEAVDEVQKDALEDELSKSMKMEKNKQTGEYEVKPQEVSEKDQQAAQKDFEQAVQEVEAEERAEFERQEAERRAQEEALRKLEAQRREKLEMEKAGFKENERDKFHLYQTLENAMYSHIRNFKQAIEKVIPRKREPEYEGGHFSGSKFDRRDLVRKAPKGDERFHMRQVERPTGEPRLFIGLLVDNTASMRGKKQDMARKTTVFFSRVNQDMIIPFMGVSFGEAPKVFKSFRQLFDNPSDRVKPALIEATEADEGSTNLHDGLKLIIDEMNDQRRRLRDCHGIIYVITDGGANAGLVGQELKDYIDENRGRLTFKAFGLAQNEGERQGIQQTLNFYFGEDNCSYPQNFDDLPDEAFRVLRTNLIKFQRFLS